MRLQKEVRLQKKNKFYPVQVGLDISTHTSDSITDYLEVCQPPLSHLTDDSCNKHKDNCSGSSGSCHHGVWPSIRVLSAISSKNKGSSSSFNASQLFKGLFVLGCFLLIHCTSIHPCTYLFHILFVYVYIYFHFIPSYQAARLELWRSGQSRRLWNWGDPHNLIW